MVPEPEKPQRTKQQRSVSLPLTIWAQVDDLIEYFGDGQNEVLTHLLNDWLSTNQEKITAQKSRINALSNEIRALEEEETSKKRRGS